MYNKNEGMKENSQCYFEKIYINYQGSCIQPCVDCLKKKKKLYIMINIFFALFIAFWYIIKAKVLNIYLFSFNMPLMLRSLISLSMNNMA